MHFWPFLEVLLYSAPRGLGVKKTTLVPKLCKNKYSFYPPNPLELHYRVILPGWPKRCLLGNKVKLTETKPTIPVLN